VCHQVQLPVQAVALRAAGRQAANTSQTATTGHVADPGH
jgi:hypothetical protein